MWYWIISLFLLSYYATEAKSDFGQNGSLQLMTIGCDIVDDFIYIKAVYLKIKNDSEVFMQYMDKTKNSTWQKFENCTKKVTLLTSSIKCKTMSIFDNKTYRIQLLNGNWSSLNLSDPFMPKTYRRQCISGQPKVVDVRKLKSTSSSIIVQAKVSQNAYYKKPTKASLKVYKSPELVKEYPCKLVNKSATCVADGLLSSTLYKLCVTMKMKYYQSYTTCIKAKTENSSSKENKTETKLKEDDISVKNVTCKNQHGYIYLKVLFAMNKTFDIEKVKLRYRGLYGMVGKWKTCKECDVEPVKSLYMLTCKTVKVMDYNTYTFKLQYKELTANAVTLMPLVYSKYCKSNHQFDLVKIASSKVSITVKAENITAGSAIYYFTSKATAYQKGKLVSSAPCEMISSSEVTCTVKRLEKCEAYYVCVTMVNMLGTKSSSCINATTKGCPTTKVGKGNAKDKSNHRSVIIGLVIFAALLISTVLVVIFVRRHWTKRTPLLKSSKSNYVQFDKEDVLFRN
ncbi:uncharacterized protein LOC130629168 isoform X2 [Hydractinia symbiolongicarpus]|nr:uncharacterized protein LOC130629168 isoform X2 [Hydractinia symbiolongicarpus]